MEDTDFAEEIDDAVYLVLGTSEVHRRGAGLYARNEPEPSGFRRIVALDCQTGARRWTCAFPAENILEALMQKEGGKLDCKTATYSVGANERMHGGMRHNLLRFRLAFGIAFFPKPVTLLGTKYTYNVMFGGQGVFRNECK